MSVKFGVVSGRERYPKRWKYFFNSDMPLTWLPRSAYKNLEKSCHVALCVCVLWDSEVITVADSGIILAGKQG